MDRACFLPKPANFISAHFADASRAIYLDVFSCAPYDPQEVVRYAVEYFKAGRYQLHIVNRH